MIRSIRHKGLKRLFDAGDETGVQRSHSKKLRLILAAIDASSSVQALDLPGFRLHALKGDQQNRWSIRVNGNWRITFVFTDGDAWLLDYEDYH
ncbi:MAG TPA: type II toxin-antitoxin system RelE/ParE family toxin [Pseudomonadales bacterium]|jgi:proteic killer suppression protein|nr:type II toxin-antitoxin system RelE/ParE family toxin [Pseudomonadales bacterium]